MKFINEEEYGIMATQMFLCNILMPILFISMVLFVLIYGSAPHSNFLYDNFGCDLNDLSYCFNMEKKA